MNYTWGLHNHDLLEDRYMDEITINNFSFMIHFYNIKQMDATLPWVCKVIDHRRHQNVVENQWNTWLRLVCHFFVLTSFWSFTEQMQSNMKIFLSFIC